MPLSSKAEATKTCQLSINGQPFNYEVGGEFSWGMDEVLFFNKGVTSNTSWEKDGFGIAKIFSPEEHQKVVEGTTDIVKKLFDQAGYKYPKDFRLEDYHKVAKTNEMHQEIISRSRFLTNKDFPINLDQIAERISKVIKRKVSGNNPILYEIDKVKEIVILRISRPNTLDINPPHRDGYLEIWKHTLNCWIPVAGCNEDSSLPLIPGSHLWNEKDVYRTNVKSASIGGLKYHVPAIIETRHGLDMVRPNPKPGEILMFTPFIVHGSAVNLNKDITRCSFELRLFDEEYRS